MIMRGLIAGRSGHCFQKIAGFKRGLALDLDDFGIVTDVDEIQEAINLLLIAYSLCTSSSGCKEAREEAFRALIHSSDSHCLSRATVFTLILMKPSILHCTVP
jgi:hypothetical protein